MTNIMAYIVAFVSQKRGVSKSTLACGLAREAAKNGLKVKIGDLDTQQGTSVDWHRTRLDAGIQPEVAVEAFGAAQQALKVAEQYDLLIIDGPARFSSGTLEIAKVAHLLVQPTGASLADLKPAVREFHGLVKAGIPKNKLAFAICRIGTPTEESETRAYLTEAGYAVLDGCIMERQPIEKHKTRDMRLPKLRLSPRLRQTVKTLLTVRCPFIVPHPGTVLG